ncbi:MAG: hypothetical protein ACYTGC_06650 [Planctomycetota bacterium]
MSTGQELDLERLMLIVVGAHLRAELSDRPLASRLRRAVLDRLDADGLEGPVPVICTDLWYLNDLALRRRPAVAIGSPDVNAATAYLAHRLPTAFVVEGVMRVHMDREAIDPQACAWGSDPDSTARAVDLFVERYLDEFLHNAHSLPTR